MDLNVAISATNRAKEERRGEVHSKNTQVWRWPFFR